MQNRLSLALLAVALVARTSLAAEHRLDLELAHSHAWQATETYPDGEFVLTSVARATDGAFTANSQGTLHGVTRDLRFPVKITNANSLLSASPPGGTVTLAFDAADDKGRLRAENRDDRTGLRVIAAFRIPPAV